MCQPLPKPYYVNKQTQTEAETETKEDIRSVEIVKEDFSYNS